MRAIVHDRYGHPDMLSLREIAPPELGDDDVLVRVRAAGMNPLDWHYLTGTPYFIRLVAGLRRPKRTVPGVDVAGVVERVGANVSAFRPGDEIVGTAAGSCAELVTAKPANIIRKPPDLSFEQAAALPVAGCTALQGLRDHGGVHEGQRVLVNGAAGGVGSFAVQIAVALGAEVTAVTSTRNIDMVRALGAAHVVDYTRDDVVEMAVSGTWGGLYDVLLDNVGNRSLRDCRSVLWQDGTLVMVSGPKHRLLGPLPRIMAAYVLFLFASQRAVTFTARETADDLRTLVEMVEADELSPVIDRTYPLEQTADAIRYLAEGHARGKVVVQA